VLSINLNIGNVVLENGWDVDLGAQFVSILFHRICSCAVGCGSSYLGGVDAIERGPLRSRLRVLVLLVSYLWEGALGENTVKISAKILAFEEGCLHQKTSFTAAKIGRSVLILS
jgi:hypothetical protein